MRAGESGAGIAPEPIDTRKKNRVTSRHGPYAECYAMSNVIGFFPVKHLGVDSAEPGPFSFKRVLNPNSGSATAARRQYQ